MDFLEGLIDWGGLTSWSVAAFDSLPDPQTGRNARRHDLPEVPMIALTASVCGAETCCGFAGFAVDRETLFREFLGLESGVSSHDTFLAGLPASISPANWSPPMRSIAKTRPPG